MDTIIVQLVNMQRASGRLLGGVFGALLGVLIAGTRWIESESDRWRRKLNKLEDRVDALEDAGTTASSGTGSSSSLTAGELQGLTASNITGVVANLAAALFTYTVNDINRVAYHQLRLTASGAVATGTVGSVRWPAALTPARAPELTMSFQNNTSAGAAKPLGLIPTFNSTNQNTGYDIDSPIAMANTDVIDIGVRVREIAA